MASNSQSPVQDLPPKDPYPAVQYKRNLPLRGVKGSHLLLAMTLICGYGLYKAGTGNAENRELMRERQWARIHLMPLLLAEEDRDIYRRHLASLEREKEVMKDVKGWKVGQSVYHTNRYVEPTYAIVPLQQKK